MWTGKVLNSQISCHTWMLMNHSSVLLLRLKFSCIHIRDNIKWNVTRLGKGKQQQHKRKFFLLYSLSAIETIIYVPNLFKALLTINSEKNSMNFCTFSFENFHSFYVLGTQNQVEVNKNHNIIKVLSSKFSAKMHQQNPHT